MSVGDTEDGIKYLGRAVQLSPEFPQNHLLFGDALAAAMWPALAGLVTALLVTVLCAAAGTLVVFGGRRLRAELVARRELRTMPPLDTAPYAVPAATLAQLRESA
jgi:hypothetical protein